MLSISSLFICFCLLLFSELEESLIVLPFSVATDMLTLLNHWLQVNRELAFARVMGSSLAGRARETEV